MKDLIFAFMLGSGEDETDAIRLAHSIRTFGGEYCFNPIWMFSQRSEEDLSTTTRQELFSSGARLITVELDTSEAPFPFTNYVTAAGIAEGLAQGEASCLAWMATDTLMFKEPSPFQLPAGKSFGGCPVHLKLLGSGVDEPVNDFWSLIYRHCQVDEERIFSTQTIADEQPMRAYFNAGLLVVHPERGLLRGWQADFERLYHLTDFEPFYQQSDLYKIFMHQAVLAGSLLSLLKQEEIEQFSFEVNYPLQLHSRIAEERRPSSLSQLITCRYEDYNETFSDPGVQNLLEKDKPLKTWLQAQFSRI